MVCIFRPEKYAQGEPQVTKRLGVFESAHGRFTQPRPAKGDWRGWVNLMTERRPAEEDSEEGSTPLKV